MKECGVVDRLSDTTQNALINIVTIFLGLAVGSKLIAAEFLKIGYPWNFVIRYGGICYWDYEWTINGEADERI